MFFYSRYNRLRLSDFVSIFEFTSTCDVINLAVVFNALLLGQAKFSERKRGERVKGTT